MRRASPCAVWTAGACLVLLTIAVAAAQVGRGAAEPPRSIRVFEGASEEGSLQQALDRAVAAALRSLPGADRMVRYKVRDITGEQGGIRGVNSVRVAIEVDAEDALPEPPADEEPVDAVRRLSPDLQVRPSPARRGALVTMELTVRNPTGRAVRVPFSTGQQYDFEVWRGDRLVYRWSQGRAFTQTLSSLTLNPRQAITFTNRWDQRTNQGAFVPAGDYTVRGYLPTRLDGLRVGDEAALTITAR